MLIYLYMEYMQDHSMQLNVDLIFQMCIFRAL